MIKKLILILAFTFISIKPELARANQVGVCIAPVADVLGPSPYYFPKDMKGKKRYQSLPFSYGQGGNFPYARIHQVLLHEKVKILKESGDEIFVECLGANLKKEQNGKLEGVRGWMLKENILPLKELEQKKGGLKKIPMGKDRTTMYLLFPHLNKSKQTLFSAGTAFVVKKIKNERVYAYCLNQKTKEIDLLIFPKHKCFFHKARTNGEKIRLFTEVLEIWSAQDGNFIPYVLGGSSWTTLFRDKQTPFRKIYHYHDKKFTAFERKHVSSEPRCGFDCSSLLLSAAKISDLPYTFKNTTAVSNSLSPLKRGEKLEEGDLILFPGHVIAVTKIEKNGFDAVQAGGYTNLGGKIFKKEGKDLFQGVKTAQDLADLYLSGKPLNYYNVDKSKTISKKHWKILKIRSLFSQQS